MSNVNLGQGASAACVCTTVLSTGGPVENCGLCHGTGVQRAVAEGKPASWHFVLDPATGAVVGMMDAGRCHADMLALEAERDRLRDLIGSLWLYIGRYHETQLTTAEKELLADVVEATSDDPNFEYERWWRQ